MTHKTSHTPGPWRANGSSVWNESHCLAVGISSDENARLIAAAPALLAALEQALAALESADNDPMEAAETARRAIASARGEG